MFFFCTREAHIPSKMGHLYLGTHSFENKDIDYKLQKILNPSFPLQAIRSSSLSKDGNFSCTLVSRCWTTTTWKWLISHLSRMGTQDNKFLVLFLNFYSVLQNLIPNNSPTFRVVESRRLPEKIATYLVSFGKLLCLAFLYGWCFLKYPWTGRLLWQLSSLLQNFWQPWTFDELNKME